MIANARMYSVTPEVGVLWRRLLAAVLGKTEPSVEIVDHAPPAPIGELWARPDKAAVFMCGLPQSLASPRPALVAAPVPSPAAYRGRAVYWTELVVRADSDFETLAQTFGHRLALTTPESQSGYAAPLHELMAHARDRPLYREVVAPVFTPMGALRAVIDGQADVAPLDSYAVALMRRHAPDLVAQVRVVASTEPTAIPAFVASASASPAIVEAFLGADRQSDSRTLMEALLLTRFERPEPAGYDALRWRFETVRAFWRSHPLAETVHPTFAL
ncbi:MAG TPA: PhnD/SsuA/transferrin family substrate-binding protein [Reyranella sp.]|nr:PhnD/SsuA/transferrin family substrate-binding protein [Reyranella sp.]